MNRIIEELEKELENKIVFEKIDVDAHPEEAQKYNVLAIPTYLILKDDQEVERIIGATSKENLLNLIDKHIS
ncbi:hypothetical protein A2Z23_03450 [Candidatus Curtissbacteria bacterium RBG_16_39_7]|uniref:Thioredoxin domain-containing protein n=1 Tax=Candidatus Curtissbacteria bacterium RBG_16_39_7 TaxID=1797707 RepID=A0A1F5G3X8_9BACT|nr:MAG: hypothetical protein A2Z23_03450 [Candidatus Curtissbacteria bacterium RBG_16_39_7]